MLAIIVVRTETATSRPGGIGLVGAVLWRGIFYGTIDGLLLSAFPILAVFAAFAGTRPSRRRTGRLAVGALAILASLAMTAAAPATASSAPRSCARRRSAPWSGASRRWSR